MDIRTLPVVRDCAHIRLHENLGAQKDVVDNVITALNSNCMIAPNYWVDRKSGNDYYLTVQFFEHGEGAIHNMADLGQIPLRDPTSVGEMSCSPTGPLRLFL